MTMKWPFMQLVSEKNLRKSGRDHTIPVIATENQPTSLRKLVLEVKASDLFQISGLSADEFSILESDLVGDMTYKTLYAYKDGKRSVMSDRVMEGVKTGNSIFYIEGNEMVMPRNGVNYG